MTLIKAQAGQPWKPNSAVGHNSIVDAVNYFKDQGHLGGGAIGNMAQRGVVVKIKNNTGGDRDQFDKVILDTLVISPADNLKEFKSRAPLFSVVAITSQNLSKSIAVLLQPVKDAKFAYALIDGVTPTQINVTSEDHDYAIPDETFGLISAASGSVRILYKESGTGENKWSVIQFPAGGGGVNIQWAKITAVTNANNYTCNIYASQYDVYNTDIPVVEDVAVYVGGIIDKMAIGDPFPVQASDIENIDYESAQQLGDI